MPDASAPAGHLPLLAPAASDDPAGFGALLAKVEEDRFFRCGSYKERCLRRRIAVRMRATGVHTFADYARVLEENAAEYDRLLDALTINVTKLFRNWDAWATLADRVVPTLLAEAGRPVRVWSAGCASGEEAYSVAAVFHRALERRGESPANVEVLGTDVDRASLAAAAEGVYGEPAFAEVPEEFRARYFTPRFPARVRPELRAIARFAHHDLLRDPAPDGSWDLIVCRNVVIYFDRNSQEALFERFHGALAPRGTLFLGKVETLLGRVRGLYAPIDHRQRIFRHA
ncbi:hypothetical protein tb265_28700 [Gemmatimonadetes bacterium T265]|nr:hypothetical protein tb265_28700 [Gemmatimonadetes bacterium T265]